MEFSEISHDELKDVISSKTVTLLDCNGTARFSEGHIPGAIDFRGEQENLDRLLPKDKNALIVSYCGSRECHAFEMGAKAAKELGYTNVKHYAPGITGWVEAGERVDSLVKAG